MRFNATSLAGTDLKLAACGLLMVLMQVILLALSKKFGYGKDTLSTPLLWYVGLLVFSGVVYLIAIFCFRPEVLNRKCAACIFLVGALMRMAAISSTPVKEDDFYRYFWDGAVVVEGFSPYRYAPDVLVPDGARDEGIPPALEALAIESGEVIGRINHPHLRTIYPPVAQAAFSLAAFISPWSISAWRAVLLGFDLAAVCLLCALLGGMNRRLSWIMVYWWNPLLVKEIYNSAHMDILVAPFLVGAILLANRRKHIFSAACLGVAVGVKVWPVLLLPFVLRPAAKNWRRLVPALVTFLIVVGVVLVPLANGGFGSDSGVAEYSKGWEMNDSLYMLLLWCIRPALRLLDFQPGYAHLVTRAIVAAILAGLVLWAARKNTDGPETLSSHCLLATAALFLLSPTQFPWYYIWCLPFLTAIPRFSLLLLTVLLPLYYLRFYFDATDTVSIFDNGVVWIEFFPVWFLIVWEWFREKAQHPDACVEAQ
ncbi:glycosyltransferase 87 family protein [Candidatus Hydrogenedentota bacterium]